MRMPLSDRLKHTAGRYLPFLRIAPPVDRKALFLLRPIRNEAIQWERTDEGEAVLTVPQRKDRVGKVVSFWFRLPAARKVQLDEVGSFVWALCDGDHTVESIVAKTAREYRMNRREVEVSVASYLQTLSERHFIGFFRRGGSGK